MTKITKILLIAGLTSIPSFNGAKAIPIRTLNPYEEKIQAILILTPNLSVIRAHEVALGLTQLNTNCKIPWQLLLSIAYHESSLRKSAVGTLKSSTTDYGLMQMNDRTIARYNLDKEKLMLDVTYSFNAACQLLMDNHTRYANRVPYWLGIYRSGTALWKKDIRQNAQRYDTIIRRTAKKLGYE